MMKRKEDKEIEDAFWQNFFRGMLESLVYYHGVPCTKIRTEILSIVDQICKEEDE